MNTEFEHRISYLFYLFCEKRVIIQKYRFSTAQASFFVEGSMKKGIVSTNKGDFTFRSIDDAINFVQTAAQENTDIWVSGEQAYPCIAISISGEFAAVNFFQNDTGDMWLSYNESNQKEVTFNAIEGGDEWTPDASAIIALSDAFLCIREFLDTYERPNCIQWQEL